MHYTFSNIGNDAPNLDNQIFVVKCSDMELYNEYAFDMEDEGKSNGVIF